MIRISALNDSSSSEDELAVAQVTLTKEAKEAEAFAAYNKALSYQQSGTCDYAEKLLRNLFEHPFLREAASLVGEDDTQPPVSRVHPGLQLLYLVHKNLAAILLQRKDLKQAMASYIEAVKIDSSEVTVWFKMGQIALKIHNYPLAKICFQQALQCNPNHWPSLDKSITVTFALGDYLMCLEHISCALEKDCHYTKGLVLRKKILSEQPSLESITKELFIYCDPQIHTIAINEEDSKEYLDECNKIQAKQRQLYEEDIEKEYKPMAFLKPLAPFTWRNVGERLLELYKFATTSDPPKSLGLEVDLRDYNFLDHSIIFGKDSVEEERKNQKKNLSASASKPPLRVTLQLKEKVDIGECPRESSPFQRAMERGHTESAGTPESLSVGDNAKECALLQRLQGCEKRSQISHQGAQTESSQKEATSSNNPWADLEDMDVGNDFAEMPSLEEAMDISNLNLTDIQKTDFAPDLFLKASEDDLGLGTEAKSLESVLSSVIDMEFNQEQKEPNSQANPSVVSSAQSQTLNDPHLGVEASVSLKSPKDLSSEKEKSSGIQVMPEQNLPSSSFNLPSSLPQSLDPGAISSLPDPKSISSSPKDLNQIASDTTSPSGDLTALPQATRITPIAVSTPAVSQAQAARITPIALSKPIVTEALAAQKSPSAVSTPIMSQAQATRITPISLSTHEGSQAETIKITPISLSTHEGSQAETIKITPIPLSTPIVSQAQTRITPIPLSTPVGSQAQTRITPIPLSTPVGSQAQTRITPIPLSTPVGSQAESIRITPIPLSTPIVSQAQTTRITPIPLSTPLGSQAETTRIAPVASQAQSSRMTPIELNTPIASQGQTTRITPIALSTPISTQTQAARTSSMAQSTPIVSQPQATRITPIALSSPELLQAQARKQSETSHLKLDTGPARPLTSQHTPHSSLVASLLSPKSNTASVYQSMLSGSPGRSKLEHSVSLYSTPIAPQTRHIEASQSILQPGQNLPSLPEEKNKSAQALSLVSRSVSEDNQQVQRSPQAAGKTLGSVTPPQQLRSPVSSLSRLGRLSTGDLIEDVVRRQIMGPSCDEVTPHQTQPHPSALASSNLSPQTKHVIGNKTPPRGSHSQISTSILKTHSPLDPHLASKDIMSPPKAHSSHEVSIRSLDFASPPKAHTSQEGSYSSPSKPYSPHDLLQPHRSLPFSHLNFQTNQFLRHSMSVDAPTYLPLNHEDSITGRFSGSVSLPRHHLNTLSVLETEALLRASSTIPSTGQSVSGLKGRPSSWRPPLNRSSSSPGYLTSASAYPSQLLPGQAPTLGDLRAWAGGATVASSLPSSHYTSPLDFYSPGLCPPDLTRSSLPGLGTNVTRKPTGLLLGSSPPSLSNPFSTSINSGSPVSSVFSLTTQSGDRKSPVRSPSSSAPTVQQMRKSPSKATSPAKHQQRNSPSHQPAGLSQTPHRAQDENIHQGDHSYHQKEKLYQAMVKSMLESNTPQQHQQKTQSPKKSPCATDPKGGAKRGPKRKSELASLGEDWSQAYKRRSTRSRSSRSKREVESIDFGKLMKQYFPQSLMVLNEEDSEDGKIVDPRKTSYDKNGEGQQEKVTKADQLPPAPGIEETEVEDVKLYVKSCLKGHGLLQLIHVYLVRLGERFGCRWYSGLSDIYLRLYDCLRKHLTIPAIWFGDDEDISPSRLREYAIIMLTKAELSLSKVMSEHSTLGSPSPSKTAASHGLSSEDLFGGFHRNDMSFLEALGDREDVFNQESLTVAQFSTRLYWLQAKQHQALWQTLDAVDCFQMVQTILEDNKGKDGTKDLVIVLPNLGADGVISLQEVSQMMDNVQRCRSLEDTRNMYNLGEFDEVVENLKATFTEKSLSKKSASCKERPSQLLLLLDSLFSLERLMEVIQWGEVSLNEAVLHFQRAPSIQLRQDWAATLVSLFEMVDKVMDKEEGILKFLSHGRLVRLAHNLVSIIQVVLDVADSVTEMPICSVRPWKILFRVLHYEEECIAQSKQQGSGEPWEEKMATDQNEEEGDIRPSLAMLIKSHEYLGRHSWCTKEEGLLLKFMMSILGKELSANHDDEDDDDEDASSAFEQCVYCLYSHPNKRGRARHLSDHGAPPVEMSWVGAGPVFHYFAPHTIPEFDSYKTSTISSDVEQLLRRIFTLIPEALQAGEKHTSVVDYIVGASNTLPAPPASSSPEGDTAALPPDPYQICSLLYYLLGDFYFKNKEPAKAVKFYQLDVAMNLTRLDSWAGLALARMSQLTQKLNSTELKVETPVTKKSEAALRCFRRAVELEETSRKLWLEFGSLAYQLHSHASRQIHYRNMLNISGEMLLASRQRRTEMLLQAKDSYRRANECEGDGSEDDWLTHYMMGKVAEKQGESPKVFLDSYKQAALCLHEEEAVYPAKLQFTTMPPHLALEALEVFFRIQASSLKLVLKGCDYECLLVLDSFVTDAHEGYFARREQKQHQAAEPSRSDAPPSASSKLTAPTSAKKAQTSLKKPKKLYTKNPVDHEYSRHKSMSDSQSEGEERKDQTQRSQLQMEDMEGSSDWSQEDVIDPTRSAAEIGSSSSNQAMAQNVFEISSPDTAKALSISLFTSPPAPKDQVVPRQEQNESSAVSTKSETEVAMDCENEEIKDKSFDQFKASSVSFKEETSNTGKGQGSKLEDDQNVGEPIKGEPKVIAMETESEDKEVFSKQGSSKQSGTSDNLDVADTDKSFKTVQGQESGTDQQVEKPASGRCESLGFSVTEIDNKGKQEASGSISQREQEVDEPAVLEMNSSTKPTECPTPNAPSVGANPAADDMDVSGVGKDDGIEGEKDMESSAQDTVLRLQSIVSKDAEKWELEDQEKPVLETSNSVTPALATSTASSGAEDGVAPDATTVSLEDVEKLRSELRQKCMSGLELCAVRFSCHYKSLYRLAHAYYVMKEYNKARDLLLGCPDWQNQPHMPAPGLFSERKQNNFFQGLWKIPIEDIDRSGSFASHVHRSMRLLMNVLADLGDLDMLLQVRNQLKRTPDSGKFLYVCVTLIRLLIYSCLFLSSICPQGLWKIPIEDIDRSGSFASHVHRSMRLLMNVLADLGDLDMLLQVRNQLKRTPDSGKKYLRDPERLVLAEEAYLKCLSAVEQAMEGSERWSEARRSDNLLSVYRIWNLGKGGKHGIIATRTLHTAFKLMMKGRTDVNRLTSEQAILYCNQNLSKLLTPLAPGQGQASQKSATDRNKQGQVASVASLEKQENAKPSVADSKEDDVSCKGDRATGKDDVPRETEKVENQPSSEAMTESLMSPPQPSVVMSPQTPVVSSLTQGTSTSGGQQDDVIVISDPE